MEIVQEVAESQGKKEENKDATAIAGLLEKLSVEENKSDGKELAETTTSLLKSVKELESKWGLSPCMHGMHEKSQKRIFQGAKIALEE